MKKWMTLLLALICVLGMGGCSHTNMTFDIGEASRLSIKSGLTGTEAHVTDAALIQSVTENINSLRFERTSAADGQVGYAYMLTWFGPEDDQLARVTITEENGYQIRHEGYYYKVGADLNIDTDAIEEMLNAALSSASAPLTLGEVMGLSPEPVPADGEDLEPGAKKLTLEEVMALSAKGEDLTWGDFEGYAYEDIGSGLYIHRYDIDHNFELRVGGSPTVEPMYIHLVSKADPETYIDIRTENVKEFIENDVVLKAPPALYVVCGEASVEALRGTTSWMYDNGNGTSSGFEADSMHPLQAKDYMTPLRLLPSYVSHIDPFTANLRFNVIPDVVQVRCWSEDCWGQYGAESEKVPVTILETETNSAMPGYGTDFLIGLKEGNYIYEVTARWDRSEKYGGTAYYSFYTEMPDLELHPIPITEDATAQTDDLSGEHLPYTPTDDLSGDHLPYTPTDDLCGYPLAPAE